jgi:glycosyltransferase involved in cell wall biosynthesis
MESILLEKPVVCTNYSGNIDFCLPEWSELVDYKLNNIPQNSVYTKLLDGVSAEWAEPNLKDATNKILKIYQNYSEYEEKIKKGREWIIENYNYENFERQIKEILKT